MKKSDLINELATALAKAQSEMKHAIKDAKNPFFKSDYATLSSISEACLPFLNKHGIAVTQTTEVYETAGVLLVTTMMHVSGQWISSSYPVHPVKNDPQSLGSALSYARRYSLAGIAGVVVGDDDAESAMDRNTPEKPKVVATSTNPSEAQLKRLFAIAHKNNWKDEDLRDYLEKMGMKSTKELSYMQYESLCKNIEKFPREASH